MSSTATTTRPRAGVIGAGFIGPVHVENLLRLGVPVTAVCGTTREARAVAARFGIPHAIGEVDYRRLIALPEVDVVHITSPNRHHCEQALAVLAAGKHCVCEKPLAMTTRETARIVAAARKAGTVFAVNYNLRFYPAVLRLRELVARGDLGDVIHVNGSYFQDWLLYDTDYNWRLLAEEGGSLRAVADIGTHWIDAASFVIGRPVQHVMADLVTHHAQRRRPIGEVQTFSKAKPARYATYDVKTEDAASLLLRFEGGARGNLAVSQVAAGRKNCLRLEVYGSTRSAAWNSEDPDKLHFGNRDTANETAFRATPPFGPDVARFTDYPGGHVEGFPDTFKMHFREVYDAIATGRRSGLFASAEDGHREVAVCEAVLRSHRTQRWVPVRG
jgi:predicted dehydrogenase